MDGRIKYILEGRFSDVGIESAEVDGGNICCIKNLVVSEEQIQKCNRRDNQAGNQVNSFPQECF